MTMSCSEASAASRKRPRFTLQVAFKSVEERETFVRRFEAVSKRLALHEGHQLDNHGLMCAMFDAVERSAPQESFPGDEHVETKSFLSNSGKMDYI